MQTFSSIPRAPAAVLAADLALAQVDALFADVRSFAKGAGGVCLSTFVVASRLKSPALYTCCGCLLAITLARLVQTRSFLKQSRRHRSQTLWWGRLYNVSAGIHIAAIGGFCLCTFIVSDDLLCRLLDGEAVILD